MLLYSSDVYFCIQWNSDRFLSARVEEDLIQIIFQIHFCLLNACVRLCWFLSWELEQKGIKNCIKITGCRCLLKTHNRCVAEKRDNKGQNPKNIKGEISLKIKNQWKRNFTKCKNFKLTKDCMFDTLCQNLKFFAGKRASFEILLTSWTWMIYFTLFKVIWSNSLV